MEIQMIKFKLEIYYGAKRKFTFSYHDNDLSIYEIMIPTLILVDCFSGFDNRSSYKLTSTTVNPCDRNPKLYIRINPISIIWRFVGQKG